MSEWIEVPLKRGSYLVDKADYALVAPHIWCLNKDGYVVRNVAKDENGKRAYIYMHRFIMNPDPDKLVDHIDTEGLKSDNRRSNLRICTSGENLCNKTRSGRGKSSLKGVSFTRYKTWSARIGFKGVEKYLGSFKTRIEACMAYNEAARKLHGEFASLNPIPQQWLEQA